MLIKLDYEMIGVQMSHDLYFIQPNQSYEKGGSPTTPPATEELTGVAQS